MYNLFLDNNSKKPSTNLKTEEVSLNSSKISYTGNSSFEVKEEKLKSKSKTKIQLKKKFNNKKTLF